MTLVLRCTWWLPKKDVTKTYHSLYFLTKIMRFFLKNVNIEHKVLWLKSCLSFTTDFCRLRQSDTNFISLLILFSKDILVTDLFHFFLSVTWEWSPCLPSTGLCKNDWSMNLHKSIISPLKWFAASRTLLYLVYMWSLFQGRAYSSIDLVCQIW